MAVCDHPGGKRDLISTDKPGVVFHVCNPSYMGGIGRRRIMVQDQWG
jgi:hypothetical protein